MATIENVADMLFSGLTSVAMGSYARTPPQAERTQSHRPQRGELLAEPALNVAGSISFRFHVVCVSYNTHTLQGFSSRTVSLSPHTKRQATSTQRQQKNWGWARASQLSFIYFRCFARQEGNRRPSGTPALLHPAGSANRAMLANHLRHHLGVRISLFLAVKSFELSVSRRDHPDRSGIFRRRWRSQFLVFHGGNLNVNVNAVQQRSWNLRNVSLNHRRRAVALPRRVAKIAARARIHRRRQHEPRWKRHRNSRARNGHCPVLQRLPHHFQHIPLKFRQLIQKEHAIVTQRNFPRPRHRASANQPGIADGVVRRSVRPRPHQPAAVFQDARHAMNPRRLDGLFERHRRQDRRDALRQHGLPRPRRPDKQNVVPARASHFQRALRRLLPVNVAQVHGILRSLRKHLVRIHLHGSERLRRIHQVHCLRQRLHRKHVHAFHHRRFFGIRFRNRERLQPKLPRGQGRRQRPAHRAHTPVQRQLPQKHHLVQLFAKKLPLATHQPQRHRQIEARPFLAHIRWSQVDRHTLSVRELESAVPQRTLYPLAALLHRVVRQSHHIEVLHARGSHVHLHLNEVGVNPVNRSALRLEEHGSQVCPRRSRGQRGKPQPPRSINQSANIRQRYSRDRPRMTEEKPKKGLRLAV